MRSSARVLRSGLGFLWFRPRPVWQGALWGALAQPVAVSLNDQMVGISNKLGLYHLDATSYSPLPEETIKFLGAIIIIAAFGSVGHRQALYGRTPRVLAGGWLLVGCHSPAHLVQCCDRRGGKLAGSHSPTRASRIDVNHLWLRFMRKQNKKYHAQMSENSAHTTQPKMSPELPKWLLKGSCPAGNL